MSNASAADAVLIYASLLRDVEISELQELGNALSTAYADFSVAFNSLYELAVRLEKEICKNQTGNHPAKEIRKLAEAGRAALDVSRIGTSTQLRAVHPQAMFLYLLSQQIDQTARCMLSPNQNCISVEAVTLINQILARIREITELQAKADDANKRWRIASVELKKRIDALRSTLVSTIHKILAFENASSSQVVKARDEAVESLNKPINDLKEFPEYKAKIATQVPGTSPIELLVLLLEGTQMWLKTPPIFGRSFRDNDDSTVVTVIPIGHTNVFPSADIQTEIKKLLAKNCGPGTDGQVKTCHDACVGIYGWRLLRPRSTLVAAIDLALRFGFFGWLNCVPPPPSTISALAADLADLAKRIQN